MPGKELANGELGVGVGDVGGFLVRMSRVTGSSGPRPCSCLAVRAYIWSLNDASLRRSCKNLRCPSCCAWLRSWLLGEVDEVDAKEQIIYTEVLGLSVDVDARTRYVVCRLGMNSWV